MQIHEVYLNLEHYRNAMERLYRLCWQTPLRRYAVAYLLGATGRRIGEVWILTTRDIDFERGTIMWYILKKRRSDYYVTLPMSQRLNDILRRYIVFNGISDRLFPVFNGISDRLFPVFNGISDRLFPVSKRQLELDVKKALNEVGLYSWKPHDLRHAFILEALLNSKSIELVRRWTQHSSYKELLEYVRVVGLEIDRPLVPW